MPSSESEATQAGKMAALSLEKPRKANLSGLIPKKVSLPSNRRAITALRRHGCASGAREVTSIFLLTAFGALAIAVEHGVLLLSFVRSSLTFRNIPSRAEIDGMRVINYLVEKTKGVYPKRNR